MTKSLSSLAVIAVLAVSNQVAHGAAFSFDSADIPKAIPEGGGTSGTTTSILVPGGTGTITDLNVFVDLDHTFVGDLQIYIGHDDTLTEVQLFNNFGGAADDITNVTFDDEAVTAIDAVAPPYGPGSFSPNPGSLSSFDGEDLAGTWTLRIEDQAIGDAGILQTWGLRGETANGVPEAGSTIIMLSLALLGLVGIAKKTSRLAPVNQ